jgi:hypothetical protein
MAITDINTCNSCGIKVYAPQPGTLQILTRRQGGGVGDGVNIEESISVGAEYRGQQYSLIETIFHTPGLHIFPGQSAVYPAEYHIHMKTMVAPFRFLTMVIPVSHLVNTGPGQDYFAATSAAVSNTPKPTLDTLLLPGTDVIQYQGPDIRGRTADIMDPEANCTSVAEWQFLLVLNVAQIRAMDLERIPREGSLSTNPRDLPAPGVTPTRAVTRDRLKRNAVLAVKGIIGSGDLATSGQASGAPTEMTCKPLKVVNGRDVIDVSGKAVDLLTMLTGTAPDPGSSDTGPSSNLVVGRAILMFFCVMAGMLFIDWLATKFMWGAVFSPSLQLEHWEPLKLIFFVTTAAVAAGYSSNIFELLNI